MIGGTVSSCFFFLLGIAERPARHQHFRARLRFRGYLGKFCAGLWGEPLRLPAALIWHLMAPVRLTSLFAIFVSAEAFSLGEVCAGVARSHSPFRLGDAIHPLQTHIPNNIAVSLRQWDEGARDRDTGYPTYGARGGGYDFNYPDFVKTYEILMKAGIQYFDCPTMMAEETFAEMLRSAK